ncbi:probable farnesyl diphosphate synthase DDB_G0268742 [Oppia nitens]|uniref:probable farnesyl diphosphate synthase DDB_G0268742 n=1 Tax=Oppia nitens TaxID=1686743 RepID=UPI0023D9C72C|nr:probable farnesyl diphosphate synthase DDB_G0268742 [Oppia nitens]
MAIFDKLNKYKNAFSVYVYQFKLAIILADKQQYDNKFVETIENFLIGMGILSGALNDYQDYYEQGLDIQEGKCTWLICRSMQLADDRQLAQLVDNYGHKNADRVQQICRVFDELDMKSEVRKFADNMFNKYQQLAAIDSGNDLLVKQIVDNISYEVRYYAKICHIYD